MLCCLLLPCIALRFLQLPCFAVSCLAFSCLAIYLTFPFLSSSCIALISYCIIALPYLALSHLVLHCLALPSLLRKFSSFASCFPSAVCQFRGNFMVPSLLSESRTHRFLLHREGPLSTFSSPLDGGRDTKNTANCRVDLPPSAFRLAKTIARGATNHLEVMSSESKHSCSQT